MSETVLLIDDDRNLVAQLGDLLRFEGYTVETAGDGEAGMRKLVASPPDLIILDMNMPQMGGIAFLKRMAEQPQGSQPPVIVFTARANMEDFFEGVEVADYLTKPCDPSILLKAIRDVLRHRAALRAVGARVASPLRVLIAEDDSVVAQRLKRAIEERGWKTEICVSGPAALEQAIVSKPAAILAKCVLTGMNGDKLAVMLANVPATRDIAIVLYDDSGLEASEDKYVTGRTGVKAFVRDNSPAALLAALGEVLR